MKYIFLTLLTIIVILNPSTTFAKENSDSDIRKIEIQNRIELRRELSETRREEIKQRILDKRATVSARLQEQRKVRIRNLFSLMVRRLNAAIERLDGLIVRIESRLTKIESENPDLDTTSIHSELESAKSKLNEAKANLDAAEASLPDVLSSQDPKQSFTILRETITDVKNQLIEIHRILAKLIGDIRGLRIGVE
jgi:hypothetical protein